VCADYSPFTKFVSEDVVSSKTDTSKCFKIGHEGMIQRFVRSLDGMARRRKYATGQASMSTVGFWLPFLLEKL
jgi:hypothetical protein